jgi:hypothetical protein
MRLKGKFLFLSITDENGQYKMAGDEKSTLHYFFIADVIVVVLLGSKT